jgi:hypothetical protein
MVEGEEDEPLIPYDGLKVVKKGVIIAETIFSCQFLRNSLITYCSTVNQGEILTVKTQEDKLGIVFQGLDRRKMGSLDVNDIDYTLELMQNRKCSDGALRLIMLSFGMYIYRCLCTCIFTMYDSFYTYPSSCTLICMNICLCIYMTVYFHVYVFTYCNIVMHTCMDIYAYMYGYLYT